MATMDQMVGKFIPVTDRARLAMLDRLPMMRLATVAGDAPIYISPLWFTLHDEAIYFPLATGDTHAANIANGGRLSAVFDEGIELANIRSIAVEGTAVQVDDAELSQTLLESIVGKYFWIDHPSLEHFVNLGRTSGRSWYRLDSNLIESWDMRGAPQPAIQESRVLPPFMINN